MPEVMSGSDLMFMSRNIFSLVSKEKLIIDNSLLVCIAPSSCIVEH